MGNMTHEKIEQMQSAARAAAQDAAGNAEVAKFKASALAAIKPLIVRDSIQSSMAAMADVCRTRAIQMRAESEARMMASAMTGMKPLADRSPTGRDAETMRRRIMAMQPRKDDRIERLTEQVARLASAVERLAGSQQTDATK